MMSQRRKLLFGFICLFAVHNANSYFHTEKQNENGKNCFCEVNIYLIQFATTYCAKPKFIMRMERIQVVRFYLFRFLFSNHSSAFVYIFYEFLIF